MVDRSTGVRRGQSRSLSLLIACICCLVTGRFGWGQVAYERPPVNYLDAPLNDAVARLQKQIDLGQVTLTYDLKSGYLPSLLRELDVRPSSQMLVFSKTSFQQSWITRLHPRAIYFNDNTYIGWVKRGDVIEVSSVNPSQARFSIRSISAKPTGRNSSVRRTTA